MNNYEEEPIDKLVRNLWGSWSQLKDATERLIKLGKENKGEKPGSKMFNRELMGNVRMSRGEFKLASQAIHRAIGRLKKEEAEEQGRIVEQNELMSEYEDAKCKASENEESFKENKKLLRETHPHLDIKNFK